MSTCLEPLDEPCEEETFVYFRCEKHLKAGDLQAYADAYAVACILYYGFDESCMRDYQHKGLSDTLVKAKAWKKPGMGWLDRDMLACGSGYDLNQFPMRYHDAAQDWLDDPKREEAFTDAQLSEILKDLDLDAEAAHALALAGKDEKS